MEALDTDERSRPWPAFTLPAIRVHLPRNRCSRSPESVFTLRWKVCSPSAGIRVHVAPEYAVVRPASQTHGRLGEIRDGQPVPAARTPLKSWACAIRAFFLWKNETTNRTGNLPGLGYELGLFEKEPAEAAGRPGREAPSSSLPIRGDGPPVKLSENLWRGGQRHPQGPPRAADASNWRHQHGRGTG
jgi:hypothetical protein